MKAVIGVAGVLMMTSVGGACPNLAGSWTCLFSDGATGQTTIMQSGETYSLTDTYIHVTSVWDADGQSYAVSAGPLKGTQQASCVEDLSLQGQQTLYASDGSGIATTFSLSPAGPNGLTGHQSATQIVNGHSLPADTVTLICKRDQSSARQ